MKCLRCGVQIDDSRSFCEGCMASMEDYPVKPGTAVTVPVRERPEETRRIKQRKPEEIIAELERKLTRLRRCIVVLLLLLAACVGFLAYRFISGEEEFVMGSNYSSVSGESTESGGLTGP